eukprot:15466999-Alexandrium_andersonii.AAC.1
MPPRVEHRCASVVLPAGVAASILGEVGGGRIAHLADIVRLLAMEASPVASRFIDGDVVWLRSVRMVTDDLPREAARRVF